MSKNSYSRVGGENVRLLQALIDEAPSYTKPTNSRNANILKSIINNTEYNEPPQSEIEELLIALKAKIGGEIEVNELTVTENGSYDAGLNKAYNPVNVELPLDSKEITANGTYNASDDNLAGFSQVTVNVEGYKLKDIPNTPTAIATFSDGADLPMPKLEVGIEAVQEGSGDPSPENIRPISGWDEVNVVDDAVYGGFINWNQLVQNGNFESTTNWSTFRSTLTVNNNIGILTLGEAPVASAQINQQVNIPFDHKILLCGELNSSVAGDISIRTFKSSSGGGTSDTITVNVQANTWTKYNVIRALNTDITKVFAIYAVASENSTLQLKNIQIIDLTQLFGETKADEIYAMEQAEAGSGVAYFKSLFYKDYYPYNSGEITNVSAVNGDADKYFTYTIDLDGIRYGGKVDLVSGQLLVDRVIITLDENSAITDSGYSLPFKYTMPNSMKKTTSTTELLGLKSNLMREVAQSATWGIACTCSLVSNSYNLFFKLTNDLNTVEKVKNYLHDTNMQIYYPLATPLTIQLTPTAIKSLEGNNNVWGDCGSIKELSYFSKPSEE